ncbi:DUF106 domain-containing protein [archaeon]|nr:DUF106 domain-containing protein [archaeon]
MIISPIIEIAVISLGLAISSQIIQNKFVDRKAMKEQQKEIKEKQKRMKELMLKEDQKSKNELEALEKEMMQQMQKMMSGSMKVMMFSLVIFLPAFALLGFFYGEAIIDLPIALPWVANGFDLFNLETWGIEIYEQTNWFGWYFTSYLAITILIGLGRKVAKKLGAMNG